MDTLKVGMRDEMVWEVTEDPGDVARRLQGVFDAGR